MSSIKSRIKCLNTNDQSLQYKLEELKRIIAEEDVQIVTISETWGQSWKEAVLEINGFNMYKKDREDGRRRHNVVLG